MSLRRSGSERILIKDGPYGSMIQTFKLDEAGYRDADVLAVWFRDERATPILILRSGAPAGFALVDTTTGTVRLTCGGVAGLLIPFNIALSPGSSGSYSGRRLRSGGNTLAYNLYTDATYTTVWGDGSSATQLVSSGVTLDLLGLAPAQVFSVYGRIPGRQTTVRPGLACALASDPAMTMSVSEAAASSSASTDPRATRNDTGNSVRLAIDSSVWRASLASLRSDFSR